MNLIQAKNIGLPKIRELYSKYIDNSVELSQGTKNTRKSDTFYLIRKGYSNNKFLELIYSDNFDELVKDELSKVLSENKSTPVAAIDISAYKNHLNTLRKFVQEYQYGEEWVIAGNPTRYDFVGAFRDLKKLDWTQKANIKAGDIVYVYGSATIKSLKFKCFVNEAEKTTPTIDDNKYNLSGEFDGTSGRYIELEALEEFYGEEYSRDTLAKYGFSSPLGPMHMPLTVSTYLYSLLDSTEYPIVKGSWTVESATRAIKKCDEYFFNHKGSVIPVEVRKFFNADKMDREHLFDISLNFEGNSYFGYIMREKDDVAITKIAWQSDLQSELDKYKDTDCEAIFTKDGDDSYTLEINVSTMIDYLGVLKYLENNIEIPYKKPEKAATNEERQKYENMMTKGQWVCGEIKKITELCNTKFGLDKCLTISWLDGSNTKTRRYLWAQMKYSDRIDNPVSVSIFVEMKSKTEACYRISLELKNDGSSAEIIDKYHTHLDMPLAEGLTYVAGSNELGRPQEINESQAVIKQKISNKTYRKVQVCKYVTKEMAITNDDFEREILKAVKLLMPYYNFVVDKGTPDNEWYPSFEEFDPGITKEKWLEYLNNDDLFGPVWLNYLACYYDNNGQGTCKEIALKYGNTFSHYNATCIQIVKNLHKYTDCKLFTDDEGKTRYWPTMFLGKMSDDDQPGQWIYKLRPELYDALTEFEIWKYLKAGGDKVVKYDKNMILYGPPGTGKTYNTVNYAVAICEDKDIKEVQAEDYEEVLKRYRKLIENRRVAFTTFHQSYGYEEFIEGIKPSKTETGNITYDIVNGIFKGFCENVKKVNIDSENFEISNDATVWKVTVAESVLKDCFENNRVRINFKLNDDSDSAIDFVNNIQKGDIIITVCLNNSARTIFNGIAVVTDDEAYSLITSDNTSARNVYWLAKNISMEAKPLNNGKQLHRATVSKVPHMNADNLIIAAKNAGYISDSFVEDSMTDPCVFIIDEINRGNISKIFGELITLIEDTKREGEPEAASAILPYSGKKFSVPSNVYILGTMNTADRSIAIMDTALRRRFQFVEMMPDSGVLVDIGADTVKDLDVAKMLDTINSRIEFLYDREHTIGHAFFTSLKDDPSITNLKSIFEKKVIPLLQEYFYEDYHKIRMVLGDDGKPEQYQFITETEIDTKLFKSSIDSITDIAEKKYSINKDAFDYIESYKLIY